jgi:hypothetical protein
MSEAKELPELSFGTPLFSKVRERDIIGNSVPGNIVAVEKRVEELSRLYFGRWRLGIGLLEISHSSSAVVSIANK